MAKFAISDHGKRLTPELFESLLFLRYNERFWDASLVAISL